MEEKKILSFCFKGDRDYVHGTDIFNVVMQEIKLITTVGEYTVVDMSIRNITRNNMFLCWGNDLTDEASKPNVIFSLSNTTKTFRLLLVDNNEPINCNYPYNENSIIHAASFDNDKKSIGLKDFKEYSLIEKIVALNKGLLNKLFPDAQGKWYFARIKLTIANWETLANDTSNIVLQFKKNMQFKLTDTIIYINDKLIGNIYFSLV